jgi:hypothetical protein
VLAVAIIAGIIGMLGRFAGQVLNTALGWATLLLFGKVPQKRQTLLLVIVFGSLIWVALVVGVLVPPVGDLIVSAVPRPDFIPESWVRLGILAGAILLPLLIGLAALFVSAKRERSLVGNIVTVLRGYPFAAVLTLVLVLLAIVGTWRKLRSLAHRWTDAHVPIVVKPGGYDAVLADLVAGLKQAGIEMAATDAGVLLSGPPKLLDLIAGRGLGELVPDRLMVLHGRDLEVLVYPSDIAISGTAALLARARAALAVRVSDAPAYLTTSAEAQHVEDQLRQIRHAASSQSLDASLAALHRIDEQLASLTVDHDEWEVLYRERLQAEQELDHGELGPGADEDAQRPSSRGALALGIVGMGLIALDLGLAIGDRLRPPAPRQE